MKKLLFIITFIFISLVTNAQVVQGIRGEFRDSVTSLTNNTDLVLKGRGTGLVNIEGAYSLPGADGQAGEVAKTNGAGVVVFDSIGADEIAPDCGTLEIGISARAGEQFPGTGIDEARNPIMFTCENSGVQLTASSNQPVSYTWTGSSSGSLGTGGEIAAGTPETITLSTAECPAVTTSITLPFNFSVPSISVDQVPVAGGMLLSVRGADNADEDYVNYYWTSAQFTGRRQGATILATSSGNYTVFAKNTLYGCSDDQIVAVSIPSSVDGLGADLVNIDSLQTDTLTTEYINSQTYLSIEADSLHLNSSKITGVADPTHVSHAVNLGYLQSNYGTSVTPSALTKNDDTNVTLTLGGTPTTALLQATSLTLGWTGNLSVARGGSGAGTFTDGGILYGNGTSAFSVTSAPAGADEFLVSTGAGTWGLESASSARTSLGLGTMATQNANSVDIDGGTIDGTIIGGTTAAAGSFTTLNASGDVAFDTDGFFFDQSTGRVGIGTNTPEQLLDVRGSMRLGDGTTAEQDINFVSANGTWEVGSNDGGNGTDGNHFYIFEAGSTYRLTLQKGTGNVGIGTTTPGSTLDVNGTLSAGATTTTTMRNSGNSGIGDDIAYYDSDGDLTRSTIDINDISTSGIQVAETTISSANFLNINSSPVTVVSAPGANNYIVIMAFAASMDYNSATYSCSGNLRLEYESSGQGTEVPASTYCSGSDQASMNVPQQTSGLPIGINQALVVKTASGNPTSGNSQIKVKVWYTIESI